MESQTKKSRVTCSVTVKSEPYGMYNRLVQAWTADGLIIGAVKEHDVAGLLLGNHVGVTVEIETFACGTKLICRIIA